MRSAPLIFIAILASIGSAAGQKLEQPFRLQSAGGPIAVDGGHAAPLLYDIDRDGKRDLLVGQYGEGRLRVYLNVGTDSIPEFAEFKWFEAGDSVARVPGG